MNRLPVVIITMGDPGGIGPEVVLKSLLRNNSLLDKCLPVIVGTYSVFESYLARHFKHKRNVLKPVRNTAEASVGAVCVIDIPGFNPGKIRHGKIRRDYGAVSHECIAYAATLALRERIKAVVTAPVSKESIIASGIDFRGHTEMLEGLAHAKGTAMVMKTAGYSVLLTTRHVPLKEVSLKLSSGLIVRQVLLACGALKKYFHINSPEVLMCGFNPHRGEGGRIGSEENEIIIPAVGILRRKGMKAGGPFPAEQLFGSSPSRCRNSLIVTFYHDQAMVPLKLLFRGRIVNMTCGLPFLRVSPAHGVAFDIAGRNIADPTSMIEALELACRVV